MACCSVNANSCGAVDHTGAATTSSVNVRATPERADPFIPDTEGVTVYENDPADVGVPEKTPKELTETPFALDVVYEMVVCDTADTDIEGRASPTATDPRLGAVLQVGAPATRTENVLDVV